MKQSALILCFLFGLSLPLRCCLGGEGPAMTRIRAMLSSGREPVRIVCFGDSITGVYYHTGGRRAYCDMLGIALMKIYPQAKLELYNAGISGNTTVQGLARIERDVLARKPHLVVVMFGMNDCARGKADEFRTNLKIIVRRCRGIGAAVVLCTPNSIYPEDSRRPVERLAAYAGIVREVAAEMSVPLADCYRAYEEVRARNPVEWMLLMSETIHPSMNGHRLFAEVIAEAISGRRVQLGDVPPFSPAVSFAFERLVRHQPVNVIAMRPYDRIVPQVLRRLYPGASIRTETWPVTGSSLQAVEQWGKGIRAKKPHLVVVAVPAAVSAANDEQFIRSYSWVLNWSLAFGKRQWDAIAILPSVTRANLNEREGAREALARRVIIGQDIGFIERLPGDAGSAEEIVLRWFRDQREAWSSAHRR